MPKLPPLTGIPDDTRQAINAALRSAARRASPLSWSIAVVIFAAGCFVWWNRETILKYQENALEVKHLLAAHAHCQSDVAELRARVRSLEARMSERQASN